MEIIFYFFSFLIILSSIGVISSSNSVYSVLWLIFTFLNSSVMFILLGAEFIAMTVVIVYVGAVAVLFLFVVMMLNVGEEKNRKSFFSSKVKSFSILALILTNIIIIIQSSFSGGYKIIEPLNKNLQDTTNAHAVGSILYTNYFVAFQLSGLILLLAMIGCITLTLRIRKGVKKQDPDAQCARLADDSVKLTKVKIGEGVDGISYK